MSEKHNKFNNKLVINWQEYRLNKVIDATVEDIHHLLQKSEKWKYNINEDINKLKMNRRQHVNLHRYFQDAHTPKEQLRKHFDLVRQVISDDVAQQLEQILNMTDEEFYKEQLIKKKKK